MTIIDTDPVPAVTFTVSEPAGEGERGDGNDRCGAIGRVRQGRDRAAHGGRDGEDARELYHARRARW